MGPMGNVDTGGNGVQGIWVTWAMRLTLAKEYMGYGVWRYGHMGNEAHRGYGVQGYGPHGQ